MRPRFAFDAPATDEAASTLIKAIRLFQDSKMDVRTAQSFRDNLPEASLQMVGAVLRPKYPETALYSFLAPSPQQAAFGFQSYNQLRIGHGGGFNYGGPSTDQNTFSVNLDTEKRAIHRITGRFTVFDDAVERLMAAYSSGSIAAQINITQEIMMAADKLYMQEAEKCLAKGILQSGVHGFASSPDVSRYRVDEPFPAADPSETYKTIFMGMNHITASNVWKPDTIFVRPIDKAIIYQSVVQNVGTASMVPEIIDKASGGTMQVIECPSMEDLFGTGRHGMIVCTRSAEAICKAPEKPLEFKAPIQVEDGYSVSFKAVLGGLCINYGKTAVVFDYSNE